MTRPEIRDFPSVLREEIPALLAANPGYRLPDRQDLEVVPLRETARVGGLSSLGLLALQAAILGEALPLEIRAAPYGDNLGWDRLRPQRERTTSRYAACHFPKTAAVLKRRAKNKAARAARKRGRG